MNTTAPPSRLLRSLMASFAVAGALAATAATASANIVVNEVESNDQAVADFVELTNTGAAPVDIGGYVIKDSNDANAKTIPAGTTLAPGAYYVMDTNSGPGGFGLSDMDSVRLYTPGMNLVDGYTWTWHAPATFGRCADGTGTFTWTDSSTRGAANDCPGPAQPWLGSDAVSIADDPAVFGQNLSGLAYQPSGSSAPGVLWAVRNNPSTLFRLIWDGAKWTPDTANGWANGKRLVYPGGGGVPDAEGVTLAGGDANGIFVATERNDDGPNSNTSRTSVLRYDVSAAGPTLTATKEWNLTPGMPGLPENAGLEAITWVPDEVLVAKGFMDDVKGRLYNPADYADHGAGLFFVGVERDGRIAAYALNKTTGAYDLVQSFASGFPAIMDLTFDAETSKLWAVCDNSCDGRTATLDVAQAGPNTGYFLVSATYARPAGMANLNNEGFAIAPQAECVNGLKPTFYSDDSNAGGHALRTGRTACTTPAPQPVPNPGPAPAPAPQPAPNTQQPGGGAMPGGAQADRTAPQIKATLKLAKTTRRNGKLSVTVTLNERANLTIKLAKGSKTLVQTARGNVAAGKRTIKLTLKRSARAGLRKGQKLTLTVQAGDAAGNVAKSTAKAKLR
jgi:hypothetical protein